jgi:GTP-binding protein Era
MTEIIKKIDTSHSDTSNTNFRSGFIGIIGRPNVGKSTLLNRLIGQKISITSNKPQTTRHKVLGIHSTDSCQMMFVDTPGFQTKHQNLMNQNMNRSVKQAIGDVDVIVWLIESNGWNSDDEFLLNLIPKNRPLILALNKLDLLENKNEVLAVIQTVQEKLAEHELTVHAFVPMSGQKGQQVDVLLETIEPLLPNGHALYDVEEITDKSIRFLTAEIIREKIFRFTGDELPYQSSVVIEKFEEKKTVTRIFACIWVERESHKIMVIGQNGSKMKEIATQARLDIEKLNDKKVY